MPALQRGSVYQLDKGRFGIRWYDASGTRRRKSPFASKSAAREWYRWVVEPELRGEPAPAPVLTLGQFVPLYLARHAANVRPPTLATLEQRLGHAVRAFGDVPLPELERMSGDLATWQAGLSERSRYGIVGALRQTLGAAVRWGYIASNPAKAAGRNRQPAPRTIRTYTRAEVDAIGAELSAAYRTLPMFAAATGMRPEEYLALERRDIDRPRRLANVLRTISGGQLVELGKTSGARRQVPLSLRALDALDALPPRLDSRSIFPASRGGLMDLDHFRSREWQPAIDAAGIARPARIYDLRSTFASDALAAGVGVFTLAKIMGTSVGMIERSYGRLLDGAGIGIAGQLDALDLERDHHAGDGQQKGTS